MKRILFIAPAFLILACEGPVTQEEYIHHEDPVIPVPVSLSLTSATVIMDYSAGAKDSTLVVTDEETFQVDINAEAAAWLNVEVTGNKIRVTSTQSNDSYLDRTGVITVIAGSGLNASSAEFSVVQSGAPKPVLRLSASEVEIGNTSGNSSTLTVTETNLETLTVSVDATWCSAAIAGSIITLTVLEDNPVEEIRTATLTVDGVRTAIDIKVTQKAAWPPSLVGQVYGEEGVYFWRNPENPYEYKVVAAKAEKRAWGPVGVLNSPLGNVNTSALAGPEACKRIRAAADYATASYALQYCDALGEGWYLPNRDEGDALFYAYDGETYFAKDKSGTATKDVPDKCTEKEKASRAAFDALLTSLPDGVALNTADWSGNGDSFWACMEASNGNGYYYRVGKPDWNTYTKTSQRFARCIKIVTVN